jgi:sulfite exporter TauE/SafE
MENIDKETLRKNRKTALIFGLGTILILLTILYIILKTIPDQKGQLVALAVSTIVLVVIIILIGRYRKRKFRQS